MAKGSKSIDALTRELSRESPWKEMGRYNSAKRAFNELVTMQSMSAARTMGKIEEMASRSRPGQTSFAVFLKYVPGEKVRFSSFGDE